MESTFKTCTVCARRWIKMIDLIRDGDLRVNGYQASFNDAHEGLFMLTHEADGCGTTLAIKAGDLAELYDGPEHGVHMAYTERCEGHCLNGHDLEACGNDCDMKWARDILQVLKNHGPEELLAKLEESKRIEAA